MRVAIRKIFTYFRYLPGYITILLLLLILLACVSFTIRRFNEPFEIQYPAYFGNRTFVPENNPTTVTGVELGRALFYEKSLSANNSISCATCHQQELAFTDGKKFSTGVDGSLQPRNTMSLANLLWVENFFWDGRARGLELQGTTPLTGLHEMGQDLAVSAGKLKLQKNYVRMFEHAFGPGAITAEKILRALAQFERTLVSADSKYDQYLQGRYQPTRSELNGISLFYNGTDVSKNLRGANCSHCHGGPKTYTELFHNNGLDTAFADTGRESVTGQSNDRGRFRVVSLRNIALTAPYMHDGRFASLQEVVDHYSDEIRASPTLSPFLSAGSTMQTAADSQNKSLQLSSTEKQDLIAFLNMLTDSSFITNKQFSDPFKSINR